VLLIMTDDAGYGVPSTFGGVIPTPALDRVAARAACATTAVPFDRAVLADPRRADHRPQPPLGRLRRDLGAVDRLSRATTASSTKDKATIGRILQDNGYATSWFGKDHNTPAFQASQAGPFDQWPQRHGLRVLLRLRRRRRQPVAAQPVPQHHPDLSVRAASPAGT
jgi:arylsulfatase